ncbi:hypothetical protein CAPN006_21700 [Capnocytophaga canimorsus]|nr:hypothetical protein CAPN006_21700 [Capnocytophaga canimorsus]
MAKQLGISDLSSKNSLSWFPNKVEGSDILHFNLHKALEDAGIPFNPKQMPFEGSIDEAFVKIKEAYKNFDDLGILKIPKQDVVIVARNVTPLQAIEIIEKTFKNNNICKK